MANPSPEPPRSTGPTPPPTGPARPPTGPTRPPTGPARQRGFFEVRWRQFRRAPRPVVRAVVSSLSVALVLGVIFLAYDIALDRGVVLPGGDLRLPYLVFYVAVVCLLGALLTYFFVPLPSGPSATRVTRTPWSLALGLFAAVPIAYLVLVLLHEMIKPVLVGR